MKYFNSPSLYATICLLLIAVGCQQAGTVDPDKFQDSSANAAKLSPEEQIAKVVAGLRDFPEEMPARSADQTYVRLYLPKMFWTKCEALVQGDLRKHEAFQSVHTLLKLQTVSFVIPSDYDFRATIDALIVPNPLFEDYAVVEEWTHTDSGTESHEVKDPDRS